MLFFAEGPNEHQNSQLYVSLSQRVPKPFELPSLKREVEEGLQVHSKGMKTRFSLSLPLKTTDATVTVGGKGICSQTVADSVTVTPKTGAELLRVSLGLPKASDIQLPKGNPLHAANHKIGTKGLKTVEKPSKPSFAERIREGLGRRETTVQSHFPSRSQTKCSRPETSKIVSSDVQEQTHLASAGDLSTEICEASQEEVHDIESTESCRSQPEHGDLLGNAVPFKSIDGVEVTSKTNSLAGDNEARQNTVRATFAKEVFPEPGLTQDCTSVVEKPQENRTAQVSSTTSKDLNMPRLETSNLVQGDADCDTFSASANTSPKGTKSWEVNKRAGSMRPVRNGNVQARAATSTAVRRAGDQPHCIAKTGSKYSVTWKVNKSNALSLPPGTSSRDKDNKRSTLLTDEPKRGPVWKPNKSRGHEPPVTLKNHDGSCKSVVYQERNSHSLY